MKFHFSYRHVDVSPSLTAYAQDQFEKISHSLMGDCRWQVSFSMGRHDCQVDISLNGPWGHFKATGTAEDFYLAVDLVAEKLERQFQRRKEQLQHHKNSERSKQGQLENVNELLEYEPLRTKKSA